MSMTDPIADMLTRIRNACMIGAGSVSCPHSKVKEAILAVLNAEGYIRGFKAIEENGKRNLAILLKYDDGGTPVIGGIQRVSRPGLRRYVNKDQIPLVRRGMGMAVISTSRGLMSDRDARKARIGGEVLCQIW